jgi:invasion protein IalB
MKRRSNETDGTSRTTSGQLANVVQPGLRFNEAQRLRRETMADETFEQNLLRMIAGTLHNLTVLTAAREMFGRSYFSLGVSEKAIVDQGGRFGWVCKFSKGVNSWPFLELRFPWKSASLVFSKIMGPQRRIAARRTRSMRFFEFTRVLSQADQRPRRRRISGIDPSVGMLRKVRSKDPQKGGGCDYARVADSMNTLHHISSWTLLVVALTLGTTLAVAEEGQPAPKTTVPNVAPAGGAEGSPEDFAWAKLCDKNEQTDNKQICVVKHEGPDPNTGIVLATAAVRSVEGEDKQSLLVGVTSAYSLVIPAGVEVKIDDGEPISLQYDVCIPSYCEAQTELTKEHLDKMRKGKQIIVAAINMQQKGMGFPLPLTGFDKAYDGPPADNAKYAEALQRQIELAKKAAEQPPAGAPQAGAQISAQPPADTTAQTKKPIATP